jgi:hypothetical protein
VRATVLHRRLAEWAVVVEHRHLGGAARLLGDVVEHGPHLVGVRHARDEVVGRLGRVGHVLRVRRRQVGDLVLGDARAERLGVAGAPALDRDHLLGLQPAVELLRLRDLVGVVVRDQLDLAPVDAALLVYLLDPVLDPVRVGHAHVGRRPAQVEDAPHLDRAVAATAASVVVVATGADERADAQQDGEHCHLNPHLSSLSF